MVEHIAEQDLNRFDDNVNEHMNHRMLVLLIGKVRELIDVVNDLEKRIK